MKLKSLLIMAFAALSSAVMAQIDYTFSDGNVPEGLTFSNNGAGTVINGNLHVEMGVQNAAEHKYRSDLGFSSAANIKLNPESDKYLAVKFNGALPNGNMTLEFNVGGTWYNGTWNSNANRTTLADGNGNTICYFDLTKNASYTGSEDLVVGTLNLKIADNTNIQNYSIDWIKTYSTTDAITSDKNIKDDGDNDYAVWNETTSTGYDNLLTAIAAAVATEGNATLEIRQNCVLVGNRATIGKNEITIHGTDPKITVTRDNTNNMFFLVNTAGTVKLNLLNITLDGQFNTGKRMVEAAAAGGGVNLDNVTFRNIVGNQTGSAVYVQKTSTIKDCKFVNVTNNVSDQDKGVIFMAANGLTLSGNNTFDKCGVNIYNDGNLDFTNSSTNHTTPINITIDLSKKSIGAKVVGNCNTDWKYVINNDGYCLLYDGTNNHLYLAQGYAATIAPNGYATLYGDATNALTIPAGVEAYWGKVNGDAVKMTKIENGVIPANTAVVLYSESPKLYQFVKSEDAGTAIAGNDLKGSSTDVELTNGTYKYYRLTTKDDVLGFYPAATGFTSKAHKAYLELPASAEAKILSISFDDETTGIEGLTIGQSTIDNCMYNLAGQKVGADYKGIVIKNGKKYLVK